MVRMKSLISLNCCQSESWVSDLMGMGLMSEWNMIGVNLESFLYLHHCLYHKYTECTVTMEKDERHVTMSQWAPMHAHALLMSHGWYLVLCRIDYQSRIGSVQSRIGSVLCRIGVSYEGLSKYSPLSEATMINVQSRLQSTTCVTKNPSDLILNWVNRLLKCVQRPTSVYSWLWQSSIQMMSPWDMEST